MILSSGGCKVSWALRGGTGSAALASALGGLQVGYKLQIRPRTTVISKKVFSITAVRRLRENQNSLSGLSTMNSADFIVGTGIRGVRDDCVDGDDIFDTGGAPENIVTTVTIVTARVGCA